MNPKGVCFAYTMREFRKVSGGKTGDEGRNKEVSMTTTPESVQRSINPLRHNRALAQDRFDHTTREQARA